jgi:hypothetical protein
MTTGRRDRLLARLILVVILVDHIPGNLLDGVTPRNFGLSDSTEAFVFLSGLSVGLVARVLETWGHF